MWRVKRSISLIFSPHTKGKDNETFMIEWWYHFSISQGEKVGRHTILGVEREKEVALIRREIFVWDGQQGNEGFRRWRIPGLTIDSMWRLCEMLTSFFSLLFTPRRIRSRAGEEEVLLILRREGGWEKSCSSPGNNPNNPNKEKGKDPSLSLISLTIDEK